MKKHRSAIPFWQREPPYTMEDYNDFVDNHGPLPPAMKQRLDQEAAEFRARLGPPRAGETVAEMLTRTKKA